MAADLVLYNDDLSSVITSFSISGGNPGVPSTSTVYRIKNDGDSTATEPYISVRAKDIEGNYVLDGVRAVDERWVEVKLTGNSLGPVVDSTSYKPIGFGRVLEIPQLEQDEWVEIEIRENRPGSAPVGQIDYELEIEPGQTSISVDLGRSETFRDGVLTKYNRGFQWIVGSDVLEVGPDDTVNVPDMFWTDSEGVPHVELNHLVTLNQTDGDSATLGAGEGYWAVLSFGTSITLTKGSKASTPLDPEDAPEVENSFCRVSVDDSGTISNSDIEMTLDVGGFNLLFTGLDFTLGPGNALVDNRLTRRTSPSPLSSSPSVTTHVWQLSDGGFDTTEDGSKPEENDLLLYILTSNATDITNVNDVRIWLGGEFVYIVIHIDGVLASGGSKETLWPFNRTGYIWPLGISFGLGNIPLDNTQGRMVADILTTDGLGGVFTSIYTSQMVDDNRASIDFDEVEPVVKSDLPEILEIKPLSRFRLELEVPYMEEFDGTQPSNAFIVIPVIL